ncbi:MAG: SDR family oxidoreductase [Phycisphaerae bacterium]|jgi:NAD(P)-dependent dehydrogenase (short-subunit alcohol dehydrogenase family)
MKKLSGKVAVVTGAAGILCRHFVETLLEEGAKVALLDLNPEAGEKLVAELKEKGYKGMLVVKCDVLDKESIKAARKAVNDCLGKVDILVNGAGGNHPKATTPAEQLLKDTPLEDSFFGIDTDSFTWVNNLNFMGTLLPTQEFGLDMVEQGGGCVINISSMSAYAPMTKVPAYSAAKAAINNFTCWLAVHLGKANIRVNAIAPGFFSTTQNKFLMFEQDGKTLSARGHKIINNTPMGKFGKPEDLKGVLRFLATDESEFVTGITIPVDGGFLAYSGV